MSAHFQTIERIFFDVSEKVQAVFPDLTIMWIFHEPGERQEAFDKVSHKFMIHPAGQMMAAELEKVPQAERFSGIACARKKSLLSVFSKTKALACFFVEANRIDDPEFVRYQAYMDVYQVLKLLNPYKSLPRILDLPISAFIPPPRLEGEEAKIMGILGGDVFSAFTCYFEGAQQSSRYLAKYRAKQMLEKQAEEKPEYQVFPVAANAVRLLISEYIQQVNFRKSGLSALFPAFSMTHEIIESFPLQTAKSWQMLCRRAQMMAWAKHDPETILGAAVYYTEDAFIRSDAHTACELLHIKPKLMTRVQFYNAFADDEFNERGHVKLSQDYFETLMAQASMQNNAKVFTDRINKQNDDFLSGTVMGWCSPRLIQALEPLQKSNSIEAVREANAIFKEGRDQVPWELIKKAARVLFEARREKGHLFQNEAIEILETYKEFDPITEAFRFSGQNIAEQMAEVVATNSRK